MAKHKKHRITWSKEPNETGLARVCQDPRGRNLKVDRRIVGRVCPPGRFRTLTNGCEWYAVDDELSIPLVNSCCGANPVFYPTMDEAAAACEAYVRACIEKARKP